MEAGLTQTYFFMAQVYQQAGEVEKGIKYCTQTMKRQITNRTYELKDFCYNCLSLSDYFISQKNFAQAEYIIYAAQQLLPEDKQKKRRLRATIQTSLANFYEMYLGQLCHCFLEGSELDPKVGEKCTVQFPEINLKWPKIEHLKDYSDAVQMFKLGNTQV